MKKLCYKKAYPSRAKEGIKNEELGMRKKKI
jgi:hypothetical protein